MIRDGDTVTLSRRSPARFDVCAQTRMPNAARGRLAHQIRQDLWRALQNLRGFAPVVAVTRGADDVIVRAGGQIDGAIPAGVAARIQAVLDDPANRHRWLAHARIRSAA